MVANLYWSHIEYDVAEWLQRKQKLEAKAVETCANVPGPGRAGAKRRTYLDAFCLLAVDYDVHTGQRRGSPTPWSSWKKQKAGTATKMMKVAKLLVHKLAACLWIFSKSGENNWSCICSEERRRLFLD